MFEKLRPLGDRALVQRLEDQEKTTSGIILPGTAKEKAQTGKVVAIGTGRKTQAGELVPMDIKVGDIVYFGKYSGTDAGKDHLIIREEEILGVVEQ